jgi:hypothetical protein
MFPNITQNAVPFAPDNTINQDREAHWEAELSKEAQQRKATAAATKTLTPTEIEEMARQVYDDLAPRAFNEGVDLSRKNDLILRMIETLQPGAPLELSHLLM